MNLRMESRNLVQRGNTLQVNLTVTSYNTPFATKISPEYVISGATIFQVMTVVAQVNNGHTAMYNNMIFIRFLKVRPDDELSYTISLSSKELKISEKRFVCDDGTWHLVHENRKQQYSFDVSVVMDAVQVSSFASLHADTELTDFELRGEDGAVRVHRVALAAASPVLRRMLSGSWRETSTGHVDVPGTSARSLQHLKDYIYLQVLPDDGVEQILLLASYYMMPCLEQVCVDKLVGGLTAQNACDLLEFAAKHKLTKLLLAILDCVQGGAVAVSEMREHFLRNK
ncbi:kelch-like protein 3 [Battus philenor]|uniref:kelch-like protein 3 n=1 Tax=Battus philenor TaxID=42288 RepID=UPI0035D09B6C